MKGSLPGRYRRKGNIEMYHLVLMLLYWTNSDTRQVDRLFRQSGLMREKWDRPVKGQETYGERIINDALRRGNRSS